MSHLGWAPAACQRNAPYTLVLFGVIFWLGGKYSTPCSPGDNCWPEKACIWAYAFTNSVYIIESRTVTTIIYSTAFKLDRFQHWLDTTSRFHRKLWSKVCQVTGSASHSHCSTVHMRNPPLRSSLHWSPAAKCRPWTGCATGSNVHTGIRTQFTLQMYCTCTWKGDSELPFINLSVCLL